MQRGFGIQFLNAAQAKWINTDYVTVHDQIPHHVQEKQKLNPKLEIMEKSY
jgi:hypothetical protein